MKHLGFVVIGAQKAATTTLYQWLRGNPDLSMPAAKESAFFDRLPAPGPEEYTAWLTQVFPGESTRTTGKATPQYMCFDWAAETMAALEPGLRLVALLRDPVERARSHWRMRARMGTETRSFRQAVEDLLDHRGDPTREEDGYIAFGEYGRVLARYRNLFPASQLLVLEDLDMQERPEQTLRDVCAFLGAAFHPPAEGYDVRYNAGASKRRLRERFLWTVFPYHLAQRVLPERAKIRLGAVLDRAGIQRPETPLSEKLPARLERRLRDHYRADAATLVSLLGRRPYWLDRWDAGDDFLVAVA